MPLELPTLDDRRYADLMDEARRLIPVHDPEWTDHNPSDPGITLIELFAYLTEMLLYRLDRITEEHQYRFLRLLNGPEWTRTGDLKADIRDTVLAVRARDRAVTALDYERLATMDFNRWLDAMQRFGTSDASPTDADRVRSQWWATTRLDFTDEANLPCWIPPVARAACVTSRNLARGSEAARAASAPAHVSLIVLPRRVVAEGDTLHDDAVASPVSVAGTLSEDRAEHAAALLPSGVVLVVGGSQGGRALATTEIYDPRANAWRTAEPLAVARTGHTLSRLPRSSGALLAVGGAGTDGLARAEAERWDPHELSWSAAGTLARARKGHTATLLRNGSVLVVGGTADDCSPIAEVERFDPAGNAWLTASPLGVARSGHSATLLASDKVLIAGGSGGDELVAATAIYDVCKDDWSAASAMGAARAGHTATRLGDGRVLVVGGTGAAGPIASAEIYDPDSGTWVAAAAPLQPRAGHTATLLPSGRVLIIGGADGDRALGNAEIYDPTADAWSMMDGSSTTGRMQHTATLLPSGAVLVVGGAAGAGLYAGAALFRPVGEPMRDSLQPPAAQTSALWGWLDERRILTTRHHVVGPIYAPISAEVIVAAAAGAVPDRVAARVRDRIVSFLDPRSGGPEGKGWPFGRDVFGSELIEQIEAVDGVDYITDLMLTGACLPDDVRCVAATRLWHAEGDPIGLALGRDHLPLPRQAAGAVVVAPETVFVRAVLEVTLTALASADAASLKREAKTAIRQFFHPLYNDTGPRADVRTDLLLAVLAEGLQQIADVENLSLSLKADAARLLIEDGETIGLRIEPGELVNWRVSVLVQPPQVQAPGDQ